MAGETEKAPRGGLVLDLLSLVPMAVFLRVAAWRGYTDEGWREAFLAGAALSAAAACLFLLLRRRARDFFLAVFLLLASGAAAFLADLTPVVLSYKRFQGSVFLLWYALARAGLLLAPGFFARWLNDPYPGLALPAAIGALAMFGWSLTQSQILFSTALPFAAYTAAFSAAAGRGYSRQDVRR